VTAVTAALACCCGQPTPCGDCCTQTPLPLPSRQRIVWTGSITVNYNICDCDPDVPNFICPCSGGGSISGGLLADGTLETTQVGACTFCNYQFPDIGNPQAPLFYNCPCACVWEKFPGGPTYTCFDVAPELCGSFVGTLNARLATFGVDQITRRWAALLQIVASLDGPANYCEHGFTTNELWYDGPPARVCSYGGFDIRTSFGSYAPRNHQVIGSPSTTIVYVPGNILFI
jgi:hypothetical protein